MLRARVYSTTLDQAIEIPGVGTADRGGKAESLTSDPLPSGSVPKASPVRQVLAARMLVGGSSSSEVLETAAGYDMTRKL